MQKKPVERVLFFEVTVRGRVTKTAIAYDGVAYLGKVGSEVGRRPAVDRDREEGVSAGSLDSAVARPAPD